VFSGLLRCSIDKKSTEVLNLKQMGADLNGVVDQARDGVNVEVVKLN
jgi:hypothetical protein